MENGKAKSLIIVLLILLLLACLGVVVWQYVKINTTNNEFNNGEAVNKVDNVQQENVQNNHENVDELQGNEQSGENREPEISKPENDEEKIDPYENYKDYGWASTKVMIKGQGIEIKDNKVYRTDSSKTVQVTNINGTPIKVMNGPMGGSLNFWILTQEGKVYSVEGEDSIASFVADLSKYNVIDMTLGTGRGVVYRPIYYLTAEGKLVDTNGDTFEALNKNFVYCFGSLGHVVYIDDKNNVYYSKNGDANYITVKDSDGNKAQAKELYMQNGIDGETIIIITKNNQIIYVSDQGKISQEKGKFKSINVYNEDYSGIMLISMDNGKNIVKYNLWTYYYDVEKGNTVDIKEESAIEFIHMYKRKPNSTDEYYEKAIILSKEQISQIISILRDLKYDGTVDKCPNDNDYKLVIKYKTGVESIIKTYAKYKTVCDDEVHSLDEGQTIETFDSIAYKFEWQ